MLASITPLGERGRQGRWGITVTAFLLGAAGAGAATGALAGALGSLAPSREIGSQSRLLILAAATSLALAQDLGPLRVPGPRRQVDQSWLHRYRG